MWTSIWPLCKIDEDIALSKPDVIKIRAHVNHASGTKTNDNFVNRNTNMIIFPKMEIIGASLLNGIVESKLSSKENIKVRNFRGASTEDMKDYANPIIPLSFMLERTISQINAIQLQIYQLSLIK